MENWVVQINNELKAYGSSIYEIDEEDQWKRYSIYKIPSRVTVLNKKAYIPQAVSFGPYHHWNKDLEAMEEDKHRALLHFLKRCRKPLEVLVQRMDEVVHELKDSYKSLDPKWTQDTQGFLKMMILDGCFMLEILRTSDGIPDDYADNDPIFSEHEILYVMPYIKRDMLMLENQLPIMVLHTLIQVESDKAQEEELLNAQILRFLYPGTTQFRSMGKCMHVLGVYRKSLIVEGPSHITRDPEPTTDDNVIRSATELQEAGITFRKSLTHSLRDVSFDRGVLRLPTMVVDDTTESMLLNLIAYERLHEGAGNEVTSYVFFIDTIVDDEMDVALLHKKGILINALGSDKAVAKLFNSLSTDIAVDREGVLEKVQKSVNRYCQKPWHKWRAKLIHDYFRNPWAFVSLIGAIFLFAFTIIQTGYTIADYYKPCDD